LAVGDGAAGASIKPVENTQIGAQHFGHCMTAQQQVASAVLLDVDLGARQALAVDPPLCWQVAPVLWNLLRRAVDVSGHIGAGQYVFLRQRPLKAAVRACRDYLEAASHPSRSAAL
jgi:hypothetical protein